MFIQRDLTNYDELSVSDKIDIMDSKYYYLEYIIDAIKNVDIMNFNLIIFEEDIDVMSNTEFLEYYNTCFIDSILPNIKEYLNIDDEFMEGISIATKRTLFKNIIKFFTTILPYTYLKQFLNTKSIENVYDALDVIKVDTIRDDIIIATNNTKNEYENFTKLMHGVKSTITSDKKKERFDTMLNVLDENMNEKIKYNDYYISIIKTSSSEKLANLCKLYIKNDFVNLV